MRFEQLKQFLALGSLRHFRQAAEQTNISTSALTRSIQTLEEEVGHQLVKRSTRSVVLTLEGEMFLQFCHTTLEDYQKTKKQLDKASGKSNNLLVVGYTNYASAIVPISCGQFMARHPEIKIEMQMQDSDALHSMLKRGEIDVFVSEYPSSANNVDVQLPDQLLLFARSDHPLANKSHITMTDLAPYSLLGCFSQSLHLQAMMDEAAQSMHKSSDIRLGSIGEVINIVRQGHNIALAAIEHTGQINNHSDLVQIATNFQQPSNERLVVKTHAQTANQSHVDELLNVITQTAKSQGLNA